MVEGRGVFTSSKTIVCDISLKWLEIKLQVPNAGRRALLVPSDDNNTRSDRVSVYVQSLPHNNIFPLSSGSTSQLSVSQVVS